MMTIAASDGLKLFIPQVYDIVWSLIILVIVALFFHKFFMPKFNAIFDERAAKIEGNIAKAEQSKKDADAAKSKYEAQLSSPSSLRHWATRHASTSPRSSNASCATFSDCWRRNE